MTTIPGPPLETTKFDVDDRGVAWLRLDRPQSANARNQQMREELCRIYRAVQISGDVNVLVLTAEGNRHFCAGMDLKESAAPETVAARRIRLQRSRDIEQLAALPMPTIAAINGAALGGGLEMALACDFRICVDDAVLGLPELTHDLVPGGGATQRLPALVGMSQAFELLFLRHRLTGAEAARIGLVNRSVKQSDLESEVAAIAVAISSLAPVPARMAKSLLRASRSVPLADGIQLELDALLTLLDERSSSAAARVEAEVTPD